MTKTLNVGKNLENKLGKFLPYVLLQFNSKIKGMVACHFEILQG